jgi:hypothetical protein
MNDNIATARRDAQATAIDSVARGFPDYVGGSLVGARFNVYLSGSPARAEISKLTSSAALPVVIHIVPTPLQKLVAVRNAITRDVKSWASRGIDITLWGPNPVEDKVDVYVRNLDSSEARSLTTAYGRLYVSIRRAGPNEILTPLANREADTVPYSGGDFVTDPTVAGGGCTTGPTVASNNTDQRYMTTAGHCYANGTAVVNGWFDFQDGSNHGGLASFGTINTDSISFYSGFDLDVEYSPLKEADNDWGNNGNLRIQKCAATASHPQCSITPTAGTHVCTSGAYDGEVCGVIVSSADRDVCVTFDDGPPFGNIVDCHLYRGGLNGVVVAGQGDSGGPVYQGATGGVYIDGTISLGGVLFACPAGPADPPGGHRMCTSTVYWTDMTAILILNNEHLLTG